MNYRRTVKRDKTGYGDRIIKMVKVFKIVGFSLLICVMLLTMITTFLEMKSVAEQPTTEADRSFEIALLFIESVLTRVLIYAVAFFTVWFVGELLYGWGEHVKRMREISHHLSLLANDPLSFEEAEEEDAGEDEDSDEW